MLTFYVWTAIAGLVVLLLGLITGSDTDTDQGADVTTEGDVHTDINHAHGHFAAGSFHWLSVKVWASFALGFGLLGTVFTLYRIPTFILWTATILGGALFAVVTSRMLAFLYQTQADSPVSVEELNGRIGRVVLAIPPGRTGEVEVRMGATVVCHPARSDDNEELRQGDEVVIVSSHPLPMVVTRFSGRD